MTWQRSFLFRMIMFLNFFQPVCFNSSSKFQVPGPAKKENVKCVITNKILKKDMLVKRSTVFFEQDKKQNPVIERNVTVGTNFTYECCGNLTNEAILQWGLYEPGVLSPSRLFSRVEVAKSSCSVSWASDFKDTRYHGRVHVEYDTTSQCVIWILSNVTKEDDNIFVATFRDNFAQGQGFTECTPVSLNATKAETPFSTISRVPTTTDTTKKPDLSPTTPAPTLTTTRKLTPTRILPLFKDSFKFWHGLLIFLGIIFVVVPLAYCVDKYMKQRGATLKINFDEENRVQSCSKDNLLYKLRAPTTDMTWAF